MADKALKYLKNIGERATQSWRGIIQIFTGTDHQLSQLMGQDCLFFRKV